MGIAAINVVRCNGSCNSNCNYRSDKNDKMNIYYIFANPQTNFQMAHVRFDYSAFQVEKHKTLNLNVGIPLVYAHVLGETNPLLGISSIIQAFSGAVYEED